MKALFDNRLAPVTFRFGFIESLFPRFSDAFLSWQKDLDTKFGTNREITNLNSPLAEALSRLEPLTDPLDRYLLVETRSNWSAIFGNGLRVNDVSSPVGYLPTVLGCRGLEISCTPDRSSVPEKDIIRPYGATTFSLYGPNKTDWLNRIRSISVTNDVTGWEFVAQGEVQPYEQTENYRKRKIVDRFTPEMLESYCVALGIDLFNPSFYGEQSLLVHTTKRAAAQGPMMSISEARSHVHIQGV